MRNEPRHLAPSTRGRLVAFALLLIIGAAGLPRPAYAQTAPPEVTYGTVGGLSTSGWPLILGIDLGFFKAEGINLSLITGSSPQNLTGEVATGSINLASNGCDSAIAAIAHGLPIKIVAATYMINPYQLVVGPSIKSWADLKGKSVLLGSKQDVTAVAFTEMAAAQHLTLDDFSILTGGTSDQRFAGLVSGNVQGAMLVQPYDLLAEAKGYRILGSADTTTKNWVFTCLIANAAWAAKNRPLVVKYLRGLRHATQYGYAHRDGSIATVAAETNVDRAFAAKTWDITFGKWRAYDPDFKMPPTALQNIGNYLIRNGSIQTIPSLTDLYDPSYVAEAVR